MNNNIEYEPDEKPPLAITIVSGVQIVVLSIAGVILIPTIVMRAGGVSESYTEWAVFGTVAVCGLSTILHSMRFWRFGTGHIVVMGPSGAYIAICIAAVASGGPELLATMVVISSLVPVLLAFKLPLFQRLLTPTLSATVLMLIPITVMPAVFDLLTVVPAGTPVSAAVLCAMTALSLTVGVALKTTGAPRLWAPILGVIVGSIVAAAFGLYDLRSVLDAPWFGYPEGQWVGFDFEFHAAFWGLLPAFLLVTIIASLRTISGAEAIQRVSRRQPRVADFRVVQGALTVDGMGNFLTGVIGTTPNAATTVGASLSELTGVAARNVGTFAGVLFVAIAFLPKVLALVLAIPGPVVAAYLGILLAMIFIVGMNMALLDGIDYRKGLIIGVSVWIGIGFQYEMIFPEQVSTIAGGLLQNGVTTGGLSAILLVLFVETTGQSRSRIELTPDPSSLPIMEEFLKSFTARNRWDEAVAKRLYAACEGTLRLLEPPDDDGEVDPRNRVFRLTACRENDSAILEFVIPSQDENIQNRLALIDEEPSKTPSEREVSLRLLRRLASTVHHRQYHGTDIVTIRVLFSES